MWRKIKDKLYYYFAEKNWGVRREYGPYVDAHQEEHKKTPWKHWWLLIRLNWHYRILRRTDVLCYTKPLMPKRRLPYLDGSESGISNRRKEIYVIKDLLKYDVVSFDIFDTLILRPFAEPADIFMIVGKRLNRTEFYRIRTDAERRAREQAKAEKGNAEVTIFDIYGIIEERTGIPRELGVRTEVEAELQYCFANPYMQRIYRLLQEQNKKIIITSDMYLPHDIMERLLAKVGYTGYERLYVSCDYGCSKRSQSLYEYVKRDFVGKSIIHVGDNAVSDIKSAQKSGLATFYYKNVHEIGAPYRADGMSPLVGSAYAGIVNIHLHNGMQTYSPYYEYGFLYGGLYVFGFCNWIQEKAKKEGIDKILFLARDGAIYQKVYRKFFGEIPDEYFLWSRIANTKYTLLKNKEDFLRQIIQDRAVNVNKCTISSFLASLHLSFLKKYLSDYRLTSPTLLVPETVSMVEKLFLDHWEEVRLSYENEKTLLCQYIQAKVGTAQKIAVVDVGWHGSGPQGLKYLIEDEFRLPYKIYCFQAGVRTRESTSLLPELMDHTIRSYMFSPIQNKNHYDVQRNTNRGLNCIFFEIFTQDVTPSFSGFSREQEFQYDIPECENYEIVREVHKGIIAFCELYYKTFRKDLIMFQISGYDAYRPFFMIIRDLRLIKNIFSKLAYSRGIGGDYENQSVEEFSRIIEQKKV